MALRSSLRHQVDERISKWSLDITMDKQLVDVIMTNDAKRAEFAKAIADEMLERYAEAVEGNRVRNRIIGL